MKEINFIGNRKICAVISMVLIVCSLGYLFTNGIQRSVDFEGGTKVMVLFKSDAISTGDLRERVTITEPKATIVKVDMDDRSAFQIKIKNPEVEKGQESEASLARLENLERAFGSFGNDEQELLDLLRQAGEGELAGKLITEDPFNIEGGDAVKQRTYGPLAANIKTSLATGATVTDVAKAAAPGRALELERGLRIAYPALNRTSVDLLAAVLKQYNPLGRPADQDYNDVAEQVEGVREQRGDFIQDIDGALTGVQLKEGEDLNQLTGFFRKNFTTGSYQVMSNETFSPSIAAELLSKAWGAVLLAIFGILAYVAVRFNSGYAVGSVVALVHDVIIALGIFALVGRELSNPVVAAFLTLVGYSLNDTIVVFDRIRDNLGAIKRPDLAKLVNSSVNQTLSRTVITSVTTFFVVAVIFWGSNNSTLTDFAFPLLIGIVVGTYSSIFVASPLILWWDKRVKPIVA